MLYLGPQEERQMMRNDILKKHMKFSLMLTTYTIGISSNEDRKFFRKFKFHTVILDEGHMLKNMKSQRFTHLMKVRREKMGGRRTKESRTGGLAWVES